MPLPDVLLPDALLLLPGVHILLPDVRMICLRRQKHILREKVKPDLMLRQRTADSMRLHGCLLVRPDCLRRIKHRDRRDMPPAVQQLRGPVDVPAERPECTILRIVSMRIEMRRAVRIRKCLRRKRMRHKMIDAAHQKMIRQIFFQLHTLFPAICAENFAHGISVLARLDGRRGRGQTPQPEMIELSVPRLKYPVEIRIILPLRIHLPADVVDSCPVLSPEPAEIMAERGACHLMLIVILDEMPDILHAVRAAPVPDLQRKVFLHQSGDHIHIGDAHPGSLIAARTLPEQIQLRGKILPESAAQSFLNFPAPRKIDIRIAHIVHQIIHQPVSELRLIREKSRDRLSEAVLIMLPVRFVDRVDQDAHGLCLCHIDVMRMISEIPGEIEDDQLSVTVRRELQCAAALCRLRRRRRPTVAILCLFIRCSGRLLRQRQPFQLRSLRNRRRLSVLSGKIDGEDPVVVKMPRILLLQILLHCVQRRMRN